MKKINFKKSKKLEKLGSNATKFLNEKVSPTMGKLASNRHLVAIRNGIVATIPLVIVGSLFLLILNFPIGGKITLGDGTQTDRYLKHLMPRELENMFLGIFRFSMGAMALYAAFGIGSELGKSYGFSQTVSGAIGTFGYLMFFDFQTFKINETGGATLFTALLASIGAVEIYRFCYRFKITIKMPSSVPPAISNSFLALTPVLFIGLIFGSLRYLLGFDLNNFLKNALAPLSNFLSNGYGGVFVIILLVTFLWSFGIHGVSMVGSVVRPFWQQAIAANSNWLSAGKPGSVPFAYPEQFLQWTVWIGGSGATLGLIIASLIFAKSKQVKAISKASFVPGIFNINEPAIFGFPIMLNYKLIIPFIFAPLASSMVSALIQMWAQVTWTSLVPWTLPAPIGAYLSSGGNIVAIFMPIITIGIATLIYAPFLISYDRDLLKQESIATKAK